VREAPKQVIRIPFGSIGIQELRELCPLAAPSSFTLMRWCEKCQEVKEEESVNPKDFISVCPTCGQNMDPPSEDE